MDAFGSDTSNSPDATEPSGIDAGSIFARLGAIDPSASLGGEHGINSGGSGGDSRTDSAGTPFDPSIHSGSLRADGTWRRRRGVGSDGTRRATGTRRAGSKATASVDAIANALSGIHFGVAALTGFDDLKLDEETEAKPLAEAVAEVAKHYDIPAFDPKVIAWISLAVVAGKVYAPKAALIKLELDARKERKKKPDTAQVIHFPATGETMPLEPAS